MRIESAHEALQVPEYKAVLAELLYQLADDDFIFAYRGSEWLGLAPHIEEDVAFSSITQDMMGHAAMIYDMLEELGEGRADDLAHLRKPEERLNAIILEEANGPGHYLHEPRFDWAFAVVRNYFYTVAKKIRLQSLKTSSYAPLAHVAAKILTEIPYHLMHWRTWFRQLILAGGEARERMESAIDKVWRDFGGVLSLGPKAGQMAAFGLIEPEEVLKERWRMEMQKVFEELGLPWKGEPGMERGDGRNRVHTPDLDQALNTLAEVYSTDPAANW